MRSPFVISLILLGMQFATAGDARVIVPAAEDPRTRHLSWPKIVRTNDGVLVLAYSAGVGHNAGGSGLAVSISEDGGESFSPPKLLCYFPDEDARYRDIGNLALGISEEGSILLLAMAYNSGKANTILGWRSEDDGKIWVRADTAALAENKTGSVFGHVFPVPGKGMAVCGHFREPRGDGLWIAYSADHGRTWGPPQTVTDKRFFEPAFLHVEGRLIGLARENEAHAYHQFFSEDLGETWQFEEKAIQADADAVHPSPFLVADPRDPDTLHALVSQRAPAHRISLWRADAKKLSWRPVREIAEGGGDWTYPWMTHLGGDEWYLVYYRGDKETASIYGKRISITLTSDEE